jgi:hypothetical protein
MTNVLHLNQLKPNLNKVKGGQNISNHHDQGLTIFLS